MRVVISLGGSTIFKDSEIDHNFIEKLSKLLVKLQRENFKFGVVTGGGIVARKYISALRNLKASETICDIAGIKISRVNALLLSAAIKANNGNATLLPCADFNSALEAIESGKIAVMGGTEPGHSTDAVAALLAEFVKADLFINASDVDYIYDKDPKKYRDAKKLEKVPINKLLELTSKNSIEAGKFPLMDILAVKIIERSKIRTIFLYAKDLSNLENAIKGKKFKGSEITF